MNSFIWGLLNTLASFWMIFIPNGSDSEDISMVLLSVIALLLIVWTFVKGITRLVAHKTKEQTSAGIVLVFLAFLILIYHACSIYDESRPLFISYATPNYFYLSGFLYGTIAIFLLAFQPVFREGGTLRDMIPYRIPYCVLAGFDFIFTVCSMFFSEIGGVSYQAYMNTALFRSFKVTDLHICVVLLNLLALIVIPIVNWRLRIKMSREAGQNAVQE